MAYEDQVLFLIPSPLFNAFICDECVSLCLDIIDEEDYENTEALEELSYNAPNETISFSNTSTDIGIGYIENYDRTESTLIKIIEIPYCPCDYTFENDTFTPSGLWGLTTLDSQKTYELGSYNFALTHIVQSTLKNPINEVMFKDTSLIKELRNDENESKLYHSDFYQLKFVYDSFGYTFQMEKLDIAESNIPEYFKFKFTMTSTINSRFMFSFTDYKIFNTTEDYDNIVCVARNNEKTIYNSTYLTYIRNGYNYDVKNKERTTESARIGLATSVVGSVVGIALGIAAQNPAILVSSVVAGTSSIISSVVSSANSINNAELSIAQKKQQYASQPVSVIGSDDIDLLDEYSNNRAKLVEYRVSDRMKKALADLFYYTGYVCNERKVPAYNTRRYFNFIQMEIDIIETNALSDEVINDLAMRWKNGVTIFHKYNNEYDNRIIAIINTDEMILTTPEVYDRIYEELQIMEGHIDE